MERETDEAPERSARLRPDKRAAIMAGGRRAFAADGFARAGIDAIAAASGVSTRTIYKHFGDKSALFAAVIADSAAQVAAEEVALIERHLIGVTTAAQVEPALRAFAIAWIAGDAHSATHRALIAQVRAEAAHLRTEIVDVWWQAGPGRVRAELVAVLARWHAAGLLEVPEPERAAVHFSQLVAAVPGSPATAITAPEREAWITAGVRVFVRGHRS